MSFPGRESWDSKAFKTAVTKDLPVLFTYVGWALRYDGTEAIIGRQGMRRWAKRLATVGNAHSSLDSDFIKLRTLLLGGAGSTTVACGDSIDDESSALEGEALMRFVIHRNREVKLRHEKIATALQGNNNRLICEVPNCGFDFLRRYGNLGFGYAHVHHLMPLREAAAHGRATKLSELAVVCANCHAMIHRGGECRPLDGLIPKRK